MHSMVVLEKMLVIPMKNGVDFQKNLQIGKIFEIFLRDEWTSILVEP